jgi:(2Fe-2S) ferredoxin
MKSRKTPYKCHLFVCTRSRNGEEKSCADGDSTAIKSMLKDAINERGWKGIVRVSESGCQGVCSVGPNVMIYPQGNWLTQVKPTDVPDILNIVEQCIPH